MKRNFTLFCILTALALSGWAQTQFQKIVGSQGTDIGVSITSGPADNLVAVGQTDSLGAGGLDVYLVNIDKSGNLLFNKTYGGSGNDAGRYVFTTGDGGYMVLGYTESFGTLGRDAYAIKLDSLGNIEWSKAYGGGDLEFFIHGSETSDNGYIFTGTTQSYGAGMKDAYLVKTDSIGNIQWTKTYGLTNNDNGHTVYEHPNGGYAVLCSFWGAGSGSGEYVLLRTDTVGTIVWSKTYGGTGLDYARQLELTSEGEYLITGFTESYGSGLKDILLIKADSVGNVIWSKTYGGTSNEVPFDIKEFTNGYLIHGYTESYGAGLKDGLLLKLDTAGNIIWANVYGGAEDDENILVENHSGTLTGLSSGFGFIGNSMSFGSNNDFYFVKTDSVGGSISCFEQDVSGIIGAQSIVIANGSVAVTDSSGGSATIVATSVDLPGVLPERICCPAELDLGNDTMVCSIDSIILDAGPGFVSYIWSDSSTAGQLIVANSGDYYVRVTDSAGCEQEDTISIVTNYFSKITTGDIVNNGGISHGASWGDYNNDGYEDLYVSNQNEGFLYRNNTDGTFTRITTGTLVTDNNWSRSANWIDYDNDGDLDIQIGNSLQSNFIYRNNGDGTFTRISSGSIVTDTDDTHGNAWADYDNDGFIDCFAANSSNQKNGLYHNNGDGTFTKVSTGAIATDVYSSITGSWADYDNDGYLDLFVTNDNTNNHLFHNNGDGTFTKISGSPVVSEGGSTGSSWGDYNNDGYLDLFVTNNNTTNYLYKNNGNGTFTKITSGSIVTDNTTSTGSTWGDMDNDGDLDLFVSNKNFENNLLYWNNGDGTFTRQTAGNIVNDGGFSLGCALSDIDKDGDLDLYVANHQSENNFLYKNEGIKGNWLMINLKGAFGSANVAGARVKIKTTAGWQMREVSAQTGRGGQNGYHVHFGVGCDVMVIDSVTVQWQSGCSWQATSVNVNQYLNINELVVNVNLGNDTTICSGAFLNLHAGTGFTSYLWSDGSTSETLITDSSGTVHVTVVDSNGCYGYDTINVNRFMPHSVDLGPDSSVCPGTSVTLDAGGDFLNYLWSDGSNTQSISVGTGGEYKVMVTDSNGCAASDKVSIGVASPDTLDQNGQRVLVYRKISSLEGNLTGALDDGDWFGQDITGIGDFDGDGIPDIAVNAPYDDEVGVDHGAVWILYLNQDGTVKGHTKIAEGLNGFSGSIGSGDRFGSCITSIGDFNKDGVTDLAVGERSDGTNDEGAIWILFMNNDGTVKSYQKINDVEGGLIDNFAYQAGFGTHVEPLGDLDGDGIPDLVVSGTRDTDGGSRRGGLWVLFMRADGTVKYHQKISDTQGNFTGVLDFEDNFGSGIANLGDIDGDGVVDIAVGAEHDDDGGDSRGAIWILFLNSDGTVKYHQKISATTGNIPFALNDWATFGHDLSEAGDIDNNGVTDLIIGGAYNADKGSNHGTAWLLYLNADGTAKGGIEIDSAGLGFTGDPGTANRFGWSVDAIGDLNGNGVSEIGIGVRNDDDGGADRGAVYILFPEKQCDTLVVNLGADTTICSGDSLTLTADPACFYRWSNGSSDQSIIVDTAGTYSVTVKDQNGCRGSDTLIIQISSSPVVNLGPDTSVCSGDTLTLNAGNYAIYQWSDSSALGTLNVTTSGNYWVTVTDSNGCTGNDSINVIVNNLPLVDLGPDTSVCSGDTLTLNAGNYTTYQWSDSSALGSLNVTTSGNYWVTVTDSNGCAGSDSIDIIINNLPVVNLGPDTSVCSGDTLTLNAGNHTTYQWSDSSAFGSLNVTTSGNYWVTVSDSNGCTGNDSINVIVNNLPLVDLGPDTSVCSGDTLTLNAGNYTTYQWSDSSALGSLNVTTSGNYWVTVTDSNGCAGSDSIDIIINNLPVVNLGPDTSVCSGDTLTLNAGNHTTYQWSDSSALGSLNVTTSGNYWVTVTDSNGCSEIDSVYVMENSLPTLLLFDDTVCTGDTVRFDAGAGFTSYLWSDGSVGQSIDVVKSDTVSVIVTGTSGCSNSDTAIAIVNDLSLLDLGPDTSFCSGGNVVLDATSNYVTYEWSDGSTGQTLVISTAGTISVKVTDTNGCETSDTIITNVHQNPVVDLGNDTAICTGESIEIDAGVGFTSYIWYDGSVGQTVNIDSSTVVFIEVTDANNCIGKDTLVVTNIGLPVIDLGPDTTICLNESFTLDAGAGFASYLWSNGLVTQTVSVNTTGLYTVTVNDGNCQQSDSITVTVKDSISGFSSVKGIIYYQGTPISSGAVKLIKKYTTGPVTMQDIDSVAVKPDGSYEFNDIADGEYLIKAWGDTAVYPNSVTTYMDSTNHWQKARTLSVGCREVSDSALVYLIDFPTTIGHGSISGTIRKGKINKRGDFEGDPVPDVDITLEQTSTSKIMGYTRTNATGNYFFGNLPDGGYVLYVDIPGLPMESTYEVEVAEGDSAHGGLDFIVGDSTVAKDTTSTGIVSIIGEKSSINVYPNPFYNFVTIEYDIEEILFIRIDVFNLLGKHIASVDSGLKSPGIHKVQYNMHEDVQSGVYLIRMTLGDQTYYQRIVRSH